MTASVDVRAMEGILVASSPAGFTLVEDEQKVTQWGFWLVCQQQVFWMFAISIIQFKSSCVATIADIS